MDRKSTRDGFGKGIIEAAKNNSNIFAITADLGSSL